MLAAFAKCWRTSSSRSELPHAPDKTKQSRGRKTCASGTTNTSTTTVEAIGSKDLTTATIRGHQESTPNGMPVQLDVEAIDVIAPFIRQTNELGNTDVLTQGPPASEIHFASDINQAKHNWLSRAVSCSAQKILRTTTSRKVKDCRCWMCDYRGFMERDAASEKSSRCSDKNADQRIATPPPQQSIASDQHAAAVKAG